MIDSSQRLRILVVDDDPCILKSLRRVLEADRHQVTVADGGNAGIEAFLAAGHRGEPFAIVLLDLAMPDTDGREVAAAIKATSPVTPIVLVTGSCDCLQAENPTPAHIERVLSKPPNVADLRRAIVELTARPKPSYSHIGR
jgi:CheY-like chemotaxis protein